MTSSLLVVVLTCEKDVDGWETACCKWQWNWPFSHFIIVCVADL